MRRAHGGLLANRQLCGFGLFSEMSDRITRQFSYMNRALRCLKKPHHFDGSSPKPEFTRVFTALASELRRGIKQKLPSQDIDGFAPARACAAVARTEEALL